MAKSKDNRVSPSPAARPRTRIQKKNRETILEAALDVFSAEGFRGATLDKIAGAAGLSKPNLLYYFASKDAIYSHLLSTLVDTWLDPLREIDPEGDPVEEIVGYVRRKLDMSRRMPRESRLFAQEIIQGAPRILPQIGDDLRTLVDTSATMIEGWIKSGRLAETDPRHLLFSIWATTQHYADFDAQVQGLLQQNEEQRFQDAETFLSAFYRRALTPKQH